MSCPGAAEIQATATVPELGLQGLATWGGRAEGRDHNGKTGELSTFLGLNGETHGERADDMGHGSRFQTPKPRDFGHLGEHAQTLLTTNHVDSKEFHDELNTGALLRLCQHETSRT